MDIFYQKKDKEESKVFNIAVAENFIVLAAEHFMIEVARGGWSRNDGYKASVGVSFKDIQEESLRKKFTKKKWSTDKTEKELKSLREKAVKAYKTEVLDKLQELGIAKDIIDSVSKELKNEHLSKLLK